MKDTIGCGAECPRSPSDDDGSPRWTDRWMLGSESVERSAGRSACANDHVAERRPSRRRARRIMSCSTISLHTREITSGRLHGASKAWSMTTGSRNLSGTSSSGTIPSAWSSRSSTSSAARHLPAGREVGVDRTGMRGEAAESPRCIPCAASFPSEAPPASEANSIGVPDHAGVEATCRERRDVLRAGWPSAAPASDAGASVAWWPVRRAATPARPRPASCPTVCTSTARKASADDGEILSDSIGRLARNAASEPFGTAMQRRAQPDRAVLWSPPGSRACMGRASDTEQASPKRASAVAAPMVEAVATRTRNPRLRKHASMRLMSPCSLEWTPRKSAAQPVKSPTSQSADEACPSAAVRMCPSG